LKPDTGLSNAKLIVKVRETADGYDVRLISTEGNTKACEFVAVLSEAVSIAIKRLFKDELETVN
jgi:hypothetical protein